MKRHVPALIALSLVAAPALAQPAPAQSTPAQAVAIPPAKPLATITATLTGGPLTATPAPLEVRVSEVTVPAGATLPAHKHDYLRVVQIVSGDLKVTFPDGGAPLEFHAGQWVVDSTDHWHEATASAAGPVVMRVTDILPPGAAATVMRPVKP
ncbi:hypothetical protein [Phenylobacterium immobile]|uniref:hypothetical protein n=1 Tax=Phenylobacterium immobile TaxID=21 RepID=UPI001146BB74|nr:hypothetical protein [Phenylobacterium immobile]